MAIVRKCAILEPPSPYTDITVVERIGYGNEAYSQFVRHIKSYDGQIREGMFYSFKHDAFANTRKELKELDHDPLTKNATR